MEQKDYIRTVLRELSESYISRRSEFTSKVITTRDIPNIDRIVKKLSKNRYRTVDEVVEDFDVVSSEWIRFGDSGFHLEMKEELAADCENKLLHCPESAVEDLLNGKHKLEEDEDYEDGSPWGLGRKRRRT